MKISVDGGGLCAGSGNKFGNFTFTKNILQALIKYDKENFYYIYSFCPCHLNIKHHPLWQYKVLLPTRLWMKLRVSLEECLQKKDVFLGLNQAVPMFSPAKIISFSHGLSYHFFPHLYRKSYARLSTQLIPMLKNSSYIIVSSKKVKDEMSEVYPWYSHVEIIPFGIPFDMLEDTELEKKEDNQKKYFLYVGMNHPIKNLKFLISSFKQFRSNYRHKNYQLILVGANGLENADKNSVFVIPTATRLKLKRLYKNAVAYLTGSLYESFNLPVLEALSQKCPVIGLKSAIIPELRPYVDVVENKYDFIEKMNFAAEKKLKCVNVEKLKKEFSWRKYIEKLVKLYSL